MALTERLALLIDSKADGAIKPLNDLGNKLQKVDAQGRQTGAALGTALQAGAVIAGVALAKMVKDGVKALAEEERLVAQTRAVLASTGGVAGVTADKVTELSESIKHYSGVSDEAVRSTENFLLTFTNIRDQAGKGNDIFDQTTKLAIDMSVAMGTDGTQAALLLGKALNDPVKGMTALMRVGVSFTQQQKDQIATLAKSGEALEAQKLILGEVNREFGGSAAAFGDTAAGAMAKAKNAVEDLEKSLAKPILEPAAHALQDFAGIVNWLNAHPMLERDAEILIGVAAAGVAASKAIGVYKAVKDSELLTTIRSATARKAAAVSIAAEGAAAAAATPEMEGLAAAESAGAAASRTGLLANIAGFAAKGGAIAGGLAVVGFGLQQLSDSIFGKSGEVRINGKSASSFVDSVGLEKAQAQLAATRAEYKKLADAHQQGTAAGKLYAQAVESLSTAIDGYKAKQAVLTGTTEDLTGALTSQTRQVVTLDQALSQLAATSGHDVTAAQIAAQTALNDLGISLDANTHALVGNSDVVLANQQAVMGMADAGMKYAQAVLAQTGSVDDATAAYQAYYNGMVTAAQAQGISAQTLAAFLAQVGELPGQFATALASQTEYMGQAGVLAGASYSAGIADGATSGDALSNVQDGANAAASSLAGAAGTAAASGQQVGAAFVAGMQGVIISATAAEHDQLTGMATQKGFTMPKFSLGAVKPKTPGGGSSANSGPAAGSYKLLLGEDVRKDLADSILTGMNPLKSTLDKVAGTVTDTWRTLSSDLQSLVDSATSYGNTALQSMLGDVTAAPTVGTMTDVTVGPDGKLVTTQRSQLVGSFQNTLFNNSRFADDIKKAKALGLAPDLLEQFVAAGPSSLDMLDALVNSPSDVKSLNATNKQIRSLASSYGVFAANDKYGAEISQKMDALIAAVKQVAPATGAAIKSVAGGAALTGKTTLR